MLAHRRPRCPTLVIAWVCSGVDRSTVALHELNQHRYLLDDSSLNELVTRSFSSAGNNKRIQRRRVRRHTFAHSPRMPGFRPDASNAFATGTRLTEQSGHSSAWSRFYPGSMASASWLAVIKMLPYAFPARRNAGNGSPLTCSGPCSTEGDNPVKVAVRVTGIVAVQQVFALPIG